MQSMKKELLTHIKPDTSSWFHDFMSLIPMLIHVNSYLFFWFSWVSKWKASFLWIDQRASRRNSSAPVMSWQRSGWCVMKAIYYAGPGARCTQLSKEKLSLIQVVVYNYPYLFGNRQDPPLDHPQHLRLNNTNSIPISCYAHYRIWLSGCWSVSVSPSRPRRLLDHHWSRLTWWFPPKIHFFFAESIIGSITLGLVIWKKLWFWIWLYLSYAFCNTE